MLSMKQKIVLVVLVSSLTAVLTAGLIRASVTYNVELVSSPDGPVVHAPARQPFNISCQVLGGDVSNVSAMKWIGTKGNDITGEGNPGIVKSGNNLLYLTFPDPKSEDRGIYKCAAKYAENYNLQYAVNIVFYDPAPEFLHDYENVTYTEGDRVELHCFALGETPMTYEWYDQSNDPIRGNASILTSSNGSYLVIDNVQLSDEGMYSCNAENKHGLSRKLFNVRVIPKSGKNDTSSFLDVQVGNVTATSVQFDITVTGPGEYIEVSYAEHSEGKEERRLIAINADNIYSVENLLPAGKYTFRFRLGNDNSTKWSREFTVTLLPDKPEIIIRRQQKGILEFEWFRRVDDIMRGTIDKYEISYYTLRMQSGNTWIPSDCVITIQLPTCRGSSYTISGLSSQIYYQIEVRAHTDSGYGEPSKQKVYMPA